MKRWVTRYGEEGSVIARPRSGRPRLINEIQQREMVQAYENNGFLRTDDFAVRFDTSVKTVRRTLHRQGIHHRRPAKKPSLTDEHKRNRLTFAREYLDFNWQNTIFTDEKTFMSSQHGRLHLWRRNGTRYEEKNIIQNTESGRISVNLWGWMSAAGPGELVAQPPGRATAVNYVEILDKNMLPTVRCVYPALDVPIVPFVQDNCPVHRAHIVNDWFTANPEISVIPWPAKSPDLNPIENLWGLMVQRWEMRNERRTEVLEAHCHQVWEDLRGTNICSNIVGSMRRRLLDVIENNGGYTKY